MSAKMASTDWRLKELIQTLGGIQVLREKISKRGIEPPPMACLEGWRKRASMPGHWALTLVQIAQEEGIINSVSQLRKK
jgi:hypothetical protein